MEWNSKLLSWDFTELEQNAGLNMSSLAGPSSGTGRQSSGIDCSVDLKLGGLGEFRPPEVWRSQPAVSTTAAGPSRRPRVAGNAGQNASCLVDGCKSDLSNSREYHRRHKVCEVHSKTPVVLVAGQEQRFCQQCSRFHQLVEFDEVKRSCRKRLDGHNRRRRKAQPESINPGNLLPNHQGSRFLMYPHLLPTPIQEHNWAGTIKTEDTLYPNHLPHVIDGQQIFSGSLCRNKNGKQIPFLQDGHTASQPFPETTSSTESSKGKILSDRMMRAYTSDCALSLLSPTQSPGIGTGQMLPAGRIPMHQSLVSSFQCDDLDRLPNPQASRYVSPTGYSYSGVEDEQVGTVLVCDADTDLHCQNVFQLAGEGSSDGASQTLPFSWQ